MLKQMWHSIVIGVRVWAILKPPFGMRHHIYADDGIGNVWQRIAGTYIVTPDAVALDDDDDINLSLRIVCMFFSFEFLWIFIFKPMRWYRWEKCRCRFECAVSLVRLSNEKIFTAAYTMVLPKKASIPRCHSVLYMFDDDVADDGPEYYVTFWMGWWYEATHIHIINKAFEKFDKMWWEFWC